MRQYVIFCYIILFGLNPLHARPIKNIKSKSIKNLNVRYNPSQLRIPGNSFKIGISVVFDNDELADTKGYLNGSLRWRNFKIEVENGYFIGGRIYLKNSTAYQMGKTIKVRIFRRSNRALLREQEIPFHFESEIAIIASPGYCKAPGSKINIGFRTIYNNEMYEDFWPRNNQSLLEKYNCTTDGVKVEKGDLYINENPFSITNHTISLVASLKKQPNIKCSFSTHLDYRKNYSFYTSGHSGSSGFNGSSGSNGSCGMDGQHGNHGGNGSNGYPSSDLEVYATAYFDTIINTELLYVQITNLSNSEIKDYFINTEGGSISIVSIGGSGGSGGDGGRGGDGGNGHDGIWTTETRWVNDSTTETISKQGPGGNGGNGGYGGDGGNGGYGGDGGDIYFVYTQFAQPLLHLINIESLGGSGGMVGMSGMGGSGGSGGSGTPSGSSGNSGGSGSMGSSGNSGKQGRIYYQEVIE